MAELACHDVLDCAVDNIRVIHSESVLSINDDKTVCIVKLGFFREHRGVSVPGDNGEGAAWRWDLVGVICRELSQRGPHNPPRDWDGLPAVCFL